ncbi:nuclear transcription factor Y subunit gamma [Sergentomyia squamirostris]
MSYVLLNSEDMSQDSSQELTASLAGGSASGDETNAPSGMDSEAQATLNSFWPIINEEVKRIKTVDAKNQNLPLARIKKIMKLDEDVKMISAEAPLLFAKASEIFIHELTLRAWVYTEDNKRRTLQRSDIAMAISKYDQFDFLIDIVPREEIKTIKKESEIKSTNNCDQVNQIQYYFQLAQQHQQALQGQTPTQIQVQSTGTPVTLGGIGNNIIVTSPTGSVQGGQATGGNAMIVNNVQHQNQPLQVLQQIVGPNGEIQHIQVQIPVSPSQLNLIRMQGGGQQQPIIVQTSQQQASQPQILQLGQPTVVSQPQVSAAQMFINASPTSTVTATSSTDG